MSGPYSAQQRRALNQVWNAAGVYGFSPLFLSLDAAGRPDLYLNTIVGCVRKWYGEEEPAALFQSWAGDRRQALLDDLAWLVLESAAYARELPARPLLAELRRVHAEAFFDQEQTLSRQEWMAKNQLSYTMQAARWRAVLGRRPPVMTPYEKRLSAALDLGGSENPFPAILETFSRFHLFTGKTKPPPALRLRLTGRLAGMMTRLMPTEIVHTDVVDLGRASGAGEGGGPAADPRRAVLRLKEDAADRQYIESCFGPSLLPDRELGLAEQALCSGIHLGCRLWYTAGVPRPERTKNQEARRMAEQALLQAERNRAAFSADAALYQNAILRLTERIQNCLHVHGQVETETARRGRLDPSRVWRAAVLGDQRVFQREEPSNRPGFAVDLLLTPPPPGSTVRRPWPPRGTFWRRAWPGAAFRCGCPAFAASGAIRSSGSSRTLGVGAGGCSATLPPGGTGTAWPSGRRGRCWRALRTGGGCCWSSPMPAPATAAASRPAGSTLWAGTMTALRR